MPLQTDTLDRLASGSRVAIIRLRSLGDCVLSIPAIRVLKNARPDLKIAVVVEDRFADVYRNNPALDEILPPSARAIRAFKPALCLNLHGGTRSARLTLISGAEIRAGFDIFRPQWIYNTPIPTAQEIMEITRKVHTVEHAAAAMFYLGAPLTWVPRASIYAEAGRSPLAPEGAYAVIHPFAATPEKTWPSGNFLQVAKHFREVVGLEPVIVGGPNDDFTAFGEYPAAMGAPLREICRLIRDASFFAGNDSGPAHIAAAFGVPQVVIFGPSDSSVWAPWRVPAVVLQEEPINKVTVDRTIRAVDRLMVAEKANA